MTRATSEIKTVRISKPPTIKDPLKLDSWHVKNEILEALNSLDLEVRDGTSDGEIRLIGDNGVQSHIRRSDGYIFYGEPTLGELFKFISLFVGLQTLDPDLHYQTGSIVGAEEKYRRPVIIYGDPQHFMPVLNLFTKLHEHGTIRQNPRELVRFAETKDELQEQIFEKVLAKKSIHGGGASLEEIEEAIRNLQPGKMFTPDNMPDKPDFTTCFYTSAGMEQDEESIRQALLAGQMAAQKGIGVVSGAGKTGLMLQVHLGCIQENGWSWGSNCPHIAAQEGLPDGMQILIDPEIYTRMYSMKKRSSSIVASAGGRGGGGTTQEVATAALMIVLNNDLMFNGKNGHREQKALVIDNRLELWGDLVPMLEPFGIRLDDHYRFGNGTEHCMEIIDRYKSGDIKFGVERTFQKYSAGYVEDAVSHARSSGGASLRA